jgi:hypothetical protein
VFGLPVEDCEISRGLGVQLHHPVAALAWHQRRRGEAGLPDLIWANPSALIRRAGGRRLDDGWLSNRARAERA